MTQQVEDFSFSLSPAPGSTSSESVKPGDLATYNFVISPLDGAFTYPITLSATGLPPGATVTFTPSTLTLGSSSATFSMAIQTAPLKVMLENVNSMNGAALALLLLLIPISSKQRKKGRALSPLMIIFAGLGALAALGAMTGCGTNSGFFGQQPSTYTITVTGTATGAAGETLQHSSTVQLTIQ